MSLGLGPLTISYGTFETDTIADFEIGGGDRLDVRYLLSEKTGFVGAGAGDAISQGYLYWVQHRQPGQAGFGTTVYIDRDGGPFTALNAPDLAVVDLDGIAATQLTAAHFIV
jgi:hypothetical protein